MRNYSCLLILTGAFILGCSEGPAPVAAPSKPTGSPGSLTAPAPPDIKADPSEKPFNTERKGDPEAADTNPQDTSAKPAPKPTDNAAPSDAKPVAIEGGTVTLTPNNTKITFVGTHSGEKPDPRTGTFTKFTGEADVDPDAKLLTSVKMDIETDSVSTPIDKLTNHLKTGDFLDVREYPKLTFESSKISVNDADAGNVTIVGQLTLHGTTKEISIPASVKVTDDGLTLVSNFTIDRTDFGMEFGEGKIEKNVALSVVIGK